MVAPQGSKQYCLDLYVDTVTGQGAQFGGGYLPNYNFAAYVTGGRYQNFRANAAGTTGAAHNRPTKGVTHH